MGILRISGLMYRSNKKYKPPIRGLFYGELDMNVYENIIVGKFIARPNRFVIYAEIDGKVEACHMPNPGRMRELLFPGVKVYVVRNKNPLNKTAYRTIGIERDGEVILIDTSKCSDVAQYLVNHHLIPGWEKYSVLRREVTMGDSRFDLLLGDEKTGEVFPVEVKSCTLFGDRGAMFPDAVTARGRKHINHLGEIGKNGHAGMLILVHWNKAEWFLPDFHTDIEFAKAFQKNMRFIDWKAAAVRWTSEFTYPKEIKLLPTSTEALEEEMGNRGDYLLVLYLDKNKQLEIGNKGMIHFPQGYYVYTGSARKNLDQRIRHHRNLRKKMHWHIDYFRKETEFIGVVPIRTKNDFEHLLAHAVSEIADWEIKGFGCSDCMCNSHLFGFLENPLHIKAFTQIEEDFEINALNQYFEK